jgi:hypothetical protein
VKYLITFLNLDAFMGVLFKKAESKYLGGILIEKIILISLIAISILISGTLFLRFLIEIFQLNM